jgi:chitin disaccharide deacetylase
MNPKKLIVNADDFGQSDGINRGIIRAFEQGILTSASLMVRYPSASDAAAYSKSNSLDIGLHVDLGEWIYQNEEWIPVYEVISLDNVKIVEEEITRQLDAFYKLVGKNPTHIDSHQHVHKSEHLLPVFIEIAKKINVTLRGCSNKVRYCGDFYGQSSDSSPLHDSISSSNLKNIITNLPEGITEMACHPGLNVDIKTMYKIERDIEVISLCDKSIGEVISTTNVQLCSFSGIPF